MRIAIIASRFNEAIVDKLIAGAEEVLSNHAVVCIRVPGALEIPIVAQQAAQSKNFDALICLGAIIRGGTNHDEYVARAAYDGIMRVSLDFEIPITAGILTTPNMDLALQRAGGSKGNAGREAALAALELVNTLNTLTDNNLL